MLSFLTLFNGCFFKNEEAVLLDTLEKKYANIEVNKSHKLQVIASIAALSKNKKIRDHFPLYQSLIQKMGDAHLTLKEPEEKAQVSFQVELKIQKKAFAKIPGQVEFKEVIKVDSVPIENWVNLNSHLVNASSVHGKRYRTLKLIESRDEDVLEVRQLLLGDGSTLSIEKINTLKKYPCVSGFPYDENNYVLKVSNFWCEKGSSKRSDVFNNFKTALDRQVEMASSYKKIILDLRDNGGGADDEVRYLLGHLVSKKIFLYSYQFTGKKKVTEYIERLPMTLGNRSIVVLINGGCFSACEVVAAVMKDGENRQLVGERTHGAAGDPLKVKLSNSVLTYPSCLVWRQNGSLYEGVGVMPTVMGEANALKRASLLN